MFQQRFLNATLDNNLKAKASQSYQSLLQKRENGELPALQPENPTQEVLSIASHFRSNFETVVVLGTGGSSLGGQSLVALQQDPFGFQRNGPRILFLDNIDPETFDRFLSTSDFSQTGFIVISKSGNTAETICQTLTIVETFNQTYPGLKIADHMIALTEPKESILTTLMSENGVQLLPCNPKIGGRFSVFSTVGLLPALIAGLDPKEIIKGAQRIIDMGGAAPAIEGSAWIIDQHKKNCNLTVMLPYCDRLNVFCKWFRQLWAESLGKQGKGLTPIDSYGTVDQHSQLQLYLDGPKDKTFTVLATNHSQQGVPLKTKIEDFHQRTMGDLMQAEQQATIETLTLNNCPTRVFDLAEINEETMGALMMNFMLETMITADLLGVNAFDQPAVEQSKRLAKQYLTGEKAA